MRYHVSLEKEAGGSRGLLHKEKRMSREDDFDDIMDSDVTNPGQDDTSDFLIDDESVGLPVDEAEDVETVPKAAELVGEKMPAPPRKSTAKKKKKAVTKPKAQAKKKVAKPARKPAAKKTAKKTAKKPTPKKTTAKKTTAKKKTRPAAKKKKATGKSRRKR